MSREPYRIGAGAGFAGDRLEPAVELINHGTLNALVFELLAERTIALAQRRKRTGSGPGYDDRLLTRLRLVLPQALDQRAKIVTNGGAADPHSAAQAVHALANALGYPNCRVAAISGDDILAQLEPAALTILETGESLSVYKERLISANAYLGIAPILTALQQEADVIITGRTADAALFLAPLVHHFDWALDDWQRLAAGTVVGHLLECAGQLTGGYFADGAHKIVPGLAKLGFPFADVQEDGTAVVSKLAQSGGILNRATCLEQLLYEVEDPNRYLTPDVIVDFQSVQLQELGEHQVQVTNATGRPAPPSLKASIGIDDGFIGSGAISYAGPGCMARAALAATIITERWSNLYRRDAQALHITYIGQNSSTPWQPVNATSETEPPEVRLRLAVQSMERQVALDLAHEVEALYTNGPAGGGGVETVVKPTVGILSVLVPREMVTPTVEIF